MKKVFTVLSVLAASSPASAVEYCWIQLRGECHQAKKARDGDKCPPQFDTLEACEASLMQLRVEHETGEAWDPVMVQDGTARITDETLRGEPGGPKAVGEARKLTPKHKLRKASRKKLPAAGDLHPPKKNAHPPKKSGDAG